MTKIDFNAVVGRTIRYQKQKRVRIEGTYNCKLVNDGHHDYKVTGIENFTNKDIYICLSILIDDDKEPTTLLVEPKELADMLQGWPAILINGFYMLLP